jgi:hypothetical protein
MATPEGYSPGIFQTQANVYDSWLRGQLGAGASPLAYQYGQYGAPMAQMQYLANPTGVMAAEGMATQPFREFMNPTGSFNPYSATDWQNRVTGIGSSIGGTATDWATEQLRQRFGMVGGADAAQNAAQLAGAPILAGSPMALQGETRAILDRLHQDWMAGGNTGNYLNYAMTDPTGIWSRFGLGTGGAATGTAGSSTD